VKWIALVKAYRATGKQRPKLLEVAEQMGWSSEQPLRDLCRELGVADWHDVHDIVAAAKV
jgi:predicted secreted protein